MAKPIEPEPAVLAAALRRLQTLPTISGDDVATVLGVHPQTVANAANADKLPFEAIRVGTRWVFPTPPIRAFLRLTAHPASALAGTA
jgi:hypothetical protein